MNNLILNSLVSSLAATFNDSGIQEVFASYSGISIRTNRGELFFSLIPEVPLLISLIQKPAKDGPLHQKGGKLNQFLRMAQIVKLDKHPDDRVIHLFLADQQEREYHLYYIAVPKRVELVLTDSKHQIITRTHFAFDTEEKFQLQEPPQTGFSNIDPQDLIDILGDLDADNESENHLVAVVSGIDKQLAGFLIAQKKENPSTLETLINMLQAQAYSLVIVNSHDENVELTPQPIASLQGLDYTEFDDDNLAATQFFRHKARLFELAKIKRDIQQVISKRTKKLKTILKKLNLDLEKTTANLDSGRFGDLILANMHQIRRGMQAVTVQDYFSENQAEISISLDPVLAPQDNADRYYKKAKKAKRGVEALRNRMKEEHKEEETLEQVKENLKNAGDNLGELRKVHKNLIDRKWITQEQKKRLKIKTLPGKRFFSSEGFEIIVGKNSAENEIVSFQVGKDNDFWMHAAGCPGSHVVLKNPERKDQPSDTSLYEAAAIAAWYSKAKNSKNVQVHWTKRRFIKKVKGGAPGKVILSAYSSVLVNPEIPRSVRQNND